MPTTITLDRHEMTSLAIAAAAAAGEAYDDERLHAARDYRRLAARLWIAAGYHAHALKESTLAEAIGNELIAIAAGEEETV